MPDGGEYALDRIGCSQVIPVLGGEVVERQQCFFILGTRQQAYAASLAISVRGSETKPGWRRWMIVLSSFNRRIAPLEVLAGFSTRHDTPPFQAPSPSFNYSSSGSHYAQAKQEVTVVDMSQADFDHEREVAYRRARRTSTS